MEIQKYVSSKINLQKYLLEFINESENEEITFKQLTQCIETQQIINSKSEFKAFLHLIVRISNHHHRHINFFIRIEKILSLFKHEMQECFSNDEIFNIFKSNKRILLFLFEEKVLIPNQSIAEIMNNNKYKERDYLYYFFNEFNGFIDFKLKAVIENKLNDSFSKKYDLSTQKRKRGENDNAISIMIQNDLIDEFIIYVNQTNLPLTSKIRKSIFETNIFLLKKEPTLIEYSAFYGSIQIFRYLYLNGVELKNSLWLYAIHGRNPELIHILEEYKVYLHDFKDVIKESIKCHHQELIIYITNVKMEFRAGIITSSLLQCIKSYNYEYFSDDYLNSNIQKELCRNDYYFITKTLLEGELMKLEVNDAYKSASNKNNDDIIQLLLQYKGIENRSFEDCISLHQIQIPSFITSIGESAFNGCSKLTKITIPSSVKIIMKLAFQNCTSLQEIIIPSSVTEIGIATFSGCSSLKSVFIPNSISKIGDNAFWGCSSLLQITIPQGVKHIQDYTFFECSSLQQISIPYRLESIGEFSFWGCSSLKQILIPSSLTFVGNYAFAGCTSLTEVSIPSSVKSYGNSVFERCSSLKKATFDDLISKIGESGFFSCSSLIQIKIPSSVTEIEDNAFWGCKSLEKVLFPQRLKSIGKNAFWSCSSLEKVDFPSSLNTIEECAFYSCSSLIKIIIPHFVKTIGKSAFSECSNLKEVAIPSSVTKIGENAFEKCYSLNQIQIPSSITLIENETFNECSSLVQILIPSSVTSIGKNAFPLATKVIRA